jgi:DNA polymerase elongation subunit (family B)
VPEPKILLFDIETAPSLGWVWGKWQTDVIEFDKDWHLLSFAWKWLDEKKINVLALPDFPGYDRNRECDKKLVTELWKLLSEADVVVGHNIDKFDIRKANARFVIHGLKPPSPYKTVDTLKLSRSKFKYDSNRLDDLGRYLGVGRKLPNTGKSLWLGCMSGDKRSWAMMRRYNAQDVALLERVYLKLRAWSTTHPNLSFFTRADSCPVCQSDELHRDGYRYLRTGKRQQFECESCGHRFTDGKLIKDVA